MEVFFKQVKSMQMKADLIKEEAGSERHDGVHLNATPTCVWNQTKAGNYAFMSSQFLST